MATACSAAAASAKSCDPVSSAPGTDASTTVPVVNRNRTQRGASAGSIASNRRMCRCAGGLGRATAPACSQGEGEGSIRGTLDVPNCWTGRVRAPARLPRGGPRTATRITLRIQSGSDFQSFSDGLTILINDRTKIRPIPRRASPGSTAKPLACRPSPEVTPPGVPVKAEAEPALVNMALYLQRSCRTQTVTLHAVDEVTIPTDGTCTRGARCAAPTRRKAARPTRRRPPASAAARASSPSRASRTESSTKRPHAERLNAGCFDIYLADPARSRAWRPRTSAALSRPHPRLVLLLLRARSSEPTVPVIAENASFHRVLRRAKRRFGDEGAKWRNAERRTPGYPRVAGSKGA